MEEYFNLKQKYERKKLSSINKIHQNEDYTLAEKRKRIKNLKVPCIKCKRRVNTIFSLKDNVYSCICGHPDSPCKLNNEVKRQPSQLLPDTIANLNESIDFIKTTIIKIKLDYLFKITNEDETVSKFETEKNSLNELNTNLNALEAELSKILKINETTTDIKEKKGERNMLVDQIKRNIINYKSTNNTQLIKDSVSFFKDSILPLNEAIRNLENEITIVETSDGNKFTLYKQKYAIETLEKEI